MTPIRYVFKKQKKMVGEILRSLKSLGGLAEHPQGLSSDPNTHVTSQAWFHVLLWPLSAGAGAGAHSHTPLHMYTNTPWVGVGQLG